MELKQLHFKIGVVSIVSTWHRKKVSNKLIVTTLLIHNLGLLYYGFFLEILIDSKFSLLINNFLFLRRILSAAQRDSLFLRISLQIFNVRQLIVALSFFVSQGVKYALIRIILG